MKHPLSRLRRLVVLTAGLSALASSLSAQTLKLAYTFDESTTTYASSGELAVPLTSRGNFQGAGADASGVSGLPGDRAWDASANTTQGAVTPANNAALTTPATGLDLSQLTGFTIAFWFRTEQSLDADAATRLVYKADRATTPVGQGFTLRSFSGRLELRIAGPAGETVINSFDFPFGSGYNKINSWIFVALTWDGSTIQYYCGGRDYRVVLAGSGAFTGPIVNNTGNLILCNTSAFNRGLDGLFDNFRLYDGALTKAELETLRQSDAAVPAVLPTGGPLRPMAPDFAVIAAADGAQTLGAAQIVRLASGRLLASHELRPVNAKDDTAATVISSSDDGGINWTPRATLALGSARLIATATGAHVLGLAEDLVIARSLDDGATWSAPVAFGTGQTWNRSLGNVWQTADHVAVALMQRITRNREGWTHGELAPVVWRAPAGADLTQLANWTRSDAVSFSDLFDKFDSEGKAGRYFGVPFRQPSAAAEGDAFQRQALAPVGWLDANVVQLLDPQHYWHNAAAPTWHVLTRAHTGSAGFAALLKVVQQPDGSLQAAPEVVPSGKKTVLLPLPGGEERFNIRYDSVSGLYWLLSTQPEDSMRRPDRGGGLAARRVLTLHFSRNLVDWCFAAIVADNTLGDVVDAALEIDNLDLAIVSRTRGSASQPDLITFRRLRNFRDLTY